MADTSYPNLKSALVRIVVGVFIFFIVAGMAAGCMTTTIASGEGGVKYSVLGGTDTTQTYGEGLKVHAPWVDVIEYDARVQEKLEDITVLSSNGLSIGTDVSIRWRPVFVELPKLHVTYGRDYYRKLVQPELRSAVREVVGRYTPEELYSSRRTELQGQILQSVEEGVETRFVEIEAILIRDVRLPEQIQRAIENKLEEEQEAERYEFTLQKEQLEAERKQIEAEGQANYQRIITESLSTQYLRFKGIEATRELAQSPNAKTVIVGAGEDGLPVILGGQ
ncbi:MAG: prohibitin family protein [Bacteroidetes bacterium]|jgi:regulator of protease activity HflC (stomatin/prohibitin superfamily)|nr:prohibitin family protein [Bacteroidota bacterium]